MRRLLVIALAGALTALAAVLGACGSDEEAYEVRAIFDNAAFIVAGEDVKVAGVTVGRIDGLSVTPDKRAAVVLEITHPGYKDFRADARCTIRPQSLIGEQFVECTPTQQRAATEALPPPLPEIEDGPGEGQRLLPVEQTSASVALDLLNNIWRLPVRQRLTLILNELGTGLAGRGEELDAVLRRSAPALQDLNAVLEILAEQNETLEQLAVDSDRILAPLARDRRRVTGFVRETQRAAAATAERREDLARTFQRFPRLLMELRPTMQRLQGLAEQGRPLAADLGAAADDVDAVLRGLGPFSAQATPTLRSLGEVGDRGIPAIRAARPVVRRLDALGGVLRPVAATLAGVLRSFESQQGIPNLMALVYYTALSINSYDDLGHYLRAALIVNTCTDFALRPSLTCSANFGDPGAASAAGVPAGPRDEVLRRTAAVLDGADPADVLREAPPGATAPGPVQPAPRPGGAGATGGALAPAAPARPSRPQRRTTPPTRDDLAARASDDVLGYLFGKDGP